MFIDFTKWHGCKNDFIVVWILQSQYNNIVPTLQRKAEEFCARHSGIGADGIIILSQASSTTLPSTMTIFNSDGSLAKTCGNGIRCAALSIYQHEIEANHRVLEFLNLEMAGQTYSCQFIPQKRQFPLVQVNMGLVQMNEKISWYQDAKKFVTQKLTEQKLAHLIDGFHLCELANKHLVFILDEPLEIAKLRELGQLLQESPLWDGINVSFAHSPSPSTLPALPQAMANQEHSEIYQAFVWERGAGETFACGSGACAIGAALLSSELIPRSAWIPILFPGGFLFTKQESQDEESTLCGPGEHIFTGKIDI